MLVKCKTCGTHSDRPPANDGLTYRCPSCSAVLPTEAEPDGSTSAAVGAFGGAALGASIAGLPGAIFGFVLGAIAGKSSKGVG